MSRGSRALEQRLRRWVDSDLESIILDGSHVLTMVVHSPPVKQLRSIRPMRALVTGIGGQDGSLLAEQLLADGIAVSGLTHRPPGEVPELIEPIAREVELLRGDLLDAGSLVRAVHDSRPDVIYHLAAPTYVPASWDDPAATFNAIPAATATILEAGCTVDARIVIAASSEIFGDAGETPQRETSPMRPLSPYGAAKLAAHHLARIWRERHDCHASSAITFNHESERRPERFVTRRVTLAVASIVLGLEQEVTLGDLDAQRDWSAARDIVRGMRLMAVQDQADDYVLASGTARTVRDLVDVAFGAAGLNPDDHVSVDPDLTRPADPTPALGDPSKARERLGWEATISFEEMIAGMLEADLARLRAGASHRVAD